LSWLFGADDDDDGQNGNGNKDHTHASVTTPSNIAYLQFANGQRGAAHGMTPSTALQIISS